MRTDDGFVLVAVLWLVAALALAMTTLGGTLRQTSAASRIEDLALLRQSSAESGLQLAAAGLLSPDRSLRWIADARAYRVSLNRLNIEIRAMDTSGLVNINRAAPDLISNLLGALGVSDAARATAMEAIEARRTVAPAVTDGSLGMMAAGPAAMVRPFGSLGEFARDTGLDAQALLRLAGLATVYGRNGRINANLASGAVFALVPGLTTLERAALINARLKAQLDHQDVRAIVANHAAYLTDAPGTIFRIQVLADGKPLDATIITGRDPGTAFHVLAWD